MRKHKFTKGQVEADPAFEDDFPEDGGTPGDFDDDFDEPADEGFDDDFDEEFDEEYDESEAEIEYVPDIVPETDEAEETEDSFEDDLVEEEEEEAEPEEEPFYEEELPEPAAADASAVPEPEEVVYVDDQTLWQGITALAAPAKRAVEKGMLIRANDIIGRMRAMLIELVCRRNGITSDFDGAIDSLSDADKQLVYSTFPTTFDQPSLMAALMSIINTTLGLM